jgi:hypothetical protein
MCFYIDGEPGETFDRRHTVADVHVDDVHGSVIIPESPCVFTFPTLPAVDNLHCITMIVLL